MLTEFRNNIKYWSFDSWQNIPVGVNTFVMEESVQHIIQFFINFYDKIETNDSCVMCRRPRRIFMTIMCRDKFDLSLRKNAKICMTKVGGSFIFARTYVKKFT